MNKVLLICFCFLFQNVCFSQNEPFYTSYDWESKPNYKIENNNEESIIALKQAAITEFFYEGQDALVEYSIEHKVFWLNSDEKIEEYNKVYIPYSESSEIKVNKARVVSASGEIIELDDSKILIAENNETGMKYKYFAFEGVEKGSFIEYFYVLKKSPKYTGQKITFQSSFPKKNISFDLYSPENLEFQFKSYNGLPEIKRDTLSKNKLHWKLSLDNLESLEEEENSAYNASKKYLIYSLYKNLYNNKIGFASYSNATKNIYSYYYEDYESRVKKALLKYINKTTSGDDKETAIRALENDIKTNLFITKANDEKFVNLEQILKNKIASEGGIVKLFVALFRELDIKHELVITCNRQELKFDNEFESQVFLNDFLFYFPKYKTYLNPIDLQSRYGFPTAYLTDNYGLFIKEITLGEFKSAVGKVKYIDAIPAEKTFDEMTLDVAFNSNDLSQNKIKLMRSISGYNAMYIQPYIHLLKEEDKKEFIEDLAKRLDKNVEILNKKIENDDPSLFGTKPLKVTVEFNSDAFVEKAGHKYLFKIGELIGKQTEMYQEKERKLDVESENTRSYFRTINVTIPEGYKIANLDDINIKEAVLKDGESIMLFNSYYEIENNVLKVFSEEYYKKNRLDISYYNDYRTIINSAADFNKITLVLEPM